MARTVRDHRLETRNARAKLPRRAEPYWAHLSEGFHLGYYRGRSVTKWVARHRPPGRAGGYNKTTLGESDDSSDADGVKVLDYRQAQDRARDWLRILQNLVESAGGRESIEDIAEKILELQRDPAKLNAFAAAAVHPRKRDKASELYINMLLSGPQTHVVNTVSNALTALTQLLEFGVAAGIGAGRRLFNAKLVERVVFSEVGARFVGMMTAIRPGDAGDQCAVREPPERDGRGSPYTRAAVRL